MAKVLTGKVAEVCSLAPAIYKMTVESGYVAAYARPGQFVNIKCCEGFNALLRRPISICNVHKEDNTFDIVFQIRGKGTEYLSKKKAGSEVDMIAPLGKSFDIREEYKNIAVVGGGIGIFPLLFLLKEFKGAAKSAFLGFRSSELIVLENEFKEYSNKLLISTDDGSRGHKGLITDLLEAYVQKNGFDIIYACGPMPMMKKVADMAEKYNIKCQVSLEQRFGCGIGVCLACACKTKHSENWEYSHVCKDGPVFWSHEIVWE